MTLRSIIYGALVLVVSSCGNRSDQTTEKTTTYSNPMEMYGDFLIEVQNQRIFPDGKTFVDCIPRIPASEIIQQYEFRRDSNDFDLRAFVEEHFELPQKYVSGFISDPSRTMEEHIEALWSVLRREPDEAESGTRIALPFPYIVPGGRFGEIYYWDSYFTMLGLQADNKTDLIQSMVGNFAFLIDTCGFVPNGSRTYFLGRSQPPFFSLMVELLAQEKGDATYRNYLPQLEKEYGFWMDGEDQLSSENVAIRRVVRLSEGAVLNRYWDDRDYPRTEMYADDVETAKQSDRPEAVMYRHLRAGAESGWDYSSRWFSDEQNLHTIQTTDLIPVDLNALLYNLENVLAKAHQLDENVEKVAFYLQAANARKAAVIRYCWNSPLVFFTDYNFVRLSSVNTPTLAGLYPLAFNLATHEQGKAVAKQISESFLQPGGVVTTLNNTGQQWDAPNGWAPLQWMTIRGLRNYGHNELANEIKARWIRLNSKVYELTGKMVEKYNVMDTTLAAGGGEYPLQDGFGWTNGVLLKLLRE